MAEQAPKVVPVSVKDDQKAKKAQFQRAASKHLSGISLSTKLVACTIAVLLVGLAVISLSLRTLVSNYMLNKTDTQLIQQGELVFQNFDSLRNHDGVGNTNGPNSYFLQVQYTDGTTDSSGKAKTTTLLLPRLKDNVVSIPVLPENGDTSTITFGKPFTTSATVKQIKQVSQSQNEDSAANDESLGSLGSSLTATLGTPSGIDHSTLTQASASWRILPMKWAEPDGNGGMTERGIIYIGLSLSDQQDTVKTLTRYCIIVGFAVALLAGSIAALLIQHTLAPLKRIEKTAAQIAAGDLSQRVPSAPENTEVGSLAASLNTMLARIETSFKEQEQTTEKMKQFVSDASHELRTPLAAIHGYAELYAMQRDEPGALERADESIDHIERSSQRMTVLVEDLLSLARLDEGRGIDVTGTANLTSLVTDAVDDLHALDPDRAITRGVVTLGVDANGQSALAFAQGQWPAVTLTGDASRLRQVVTNIVGNVHRYTPATSPCEAALNVLPAAIDPTTLADLAPNDESMRRIVEAAEVAASTQSGYQYAVLQFIDHGPGVSDESRAKLFERFYTSDPSRAREKGGTGLGLAIARSVVRAHHGFIGATATNGGGLTFTVVLPIAAIEQQPATTAKTAKEAKQRTSWFASSKQTSSKQDGAISPQA